MKSKLQEYRSYLYESEKAELTIEKYLSEAEKLLRYLVGKEICKERMIDYRAELQKLYSVRTVNNKISAINSFLDFAGYSNCKVKLLKMQRKAFADDNRELTENEYKRLLEAAERKANKRDYYILLAIAGTGIRISELQFITAEAVRSCRAQINMKGKCRTVIIPKTLSSKLKEYMKLEGIQNGALFKSKSGIPVDRSNICHSLKKLAKTAKVPAEKVFPHNLRHLFAREFYSVSKDVVHLADVLGHSNIETTRIYLAETIASHEKTIMKMKLI